MDNNQTETDMFGSVEAIRAINIPNYLPISGLESPTNNIEYILQRKATEHMKNGRMDLAIECLRKSNEIMQYSNFTGSAIDYGRLAMFLADEGRYDEAIEEIERMKQYYPREGYCQIMSYIHRKAGRDSDAAFFEEEAGVLQIQKYREMYQFAKRKNALNEMISIRSILKELGDTEIPQDTFPQWMEDSTAASELYRKKDFDGALQFALSSLNANSGNGSIYIRIADIYMRLNRLPDSIEILERATTLDLYKSRKDTDYWFQHKVDKALVGYREKLARGYVYRSRARRSN